MAEQWSEIVKPIAILTSAGLIGTLARWRDWRNPPDMKMPDGSAHPNAGHFSKAKMFGDLVFVPALTIIGIGSMNILGALQVSWAQGAVMVGVCVAALLGSATLINSWERIRDAIVDGIKKRIGGGS